MLKLLALLCITTTILCQDAMEPDVRFGDENDRFDVSAIMQQSKSYFNDEPSYKSRIESSMKGDDDAMDGIPERRSGIKSRMRRNDGLGEPIPLRRSRRTKDSLAYAVQQMELRRAKNNLEDAITQRQSRRAEDNDADAANPQRQSRRSEGNLAYAVQQMQARRAKNNLEDAIPQRQSRRSEDSLAYAIPQRQSRRNSLKSAIPQRRQDYAYHDKMEPDKDPERADYEANLKAYAPKKKNGTIFKNIIDDLHAGKIYRSRRNDNELANEFIDPELMIMMEHAVPINAKFQGYLTAPLVE